MKSEVKLLLFKWLIVALVSGTAISARASESEVVALLVAAEEQIERTDNLGAALELIRIYETVLAVSPDNYDALWSLARYNVLVGIAYTKDKKEKKKYYLKAVEYSERAMYTNPEFKARIDRGEKIWSACDSLTKREIAALYYWYNANGLISKECQSRFEQYLSSYMLPRYKKVMTRMIEIDPEWAGGHPLFAWAGYYAAVPKLLGGDLDKAEEFFNKAEKAGPDWIYIRWSKAALLHTMRNDKEAFISDLEWVLDQDPHEAESPYPFNVYFQREAAIMLEHVGEYFDK